MLLLCLNVLVVFPLANVLLLLDFGSYPVNKLNFLLKISGLPTIERETILLLSNFGPIFESYLHNYILIGSLKIFLVYS